MISASCETHQVWAKSVLCCGMRSCRGLSEGVVVRRAWSELQGKKKIAQKRNKPIQVRLAWWVLVSAVVLRLQHWLKFSKAESVRFFVFVFVFVVGVIIIIVIWVFVLLAVLCFLHLRILRIFFTRLYYGYCERLGSGVRRSFLWGHARFDKDDGWVTAGFGDGTCGRTCGWFDRRGTWCGGGWAFRRRHIASGFAGRDGRTTRCRWLSVAYKTGYSWIVQSC